MCKQAYLGSFLLIGFSFFIISEGREFGRDLLHERPLSILLILR